MQLGWSFKGSYKTTLDIFLTLFPYNYWTGIFLICPLAFEQLTSFASNEKQLSALSLN
jgi:hypothetical protein